MRWLAAVILSGVVGGGALGCKNRELEARLAEQEARLAESEAKVAVCSQQRATLETTLAAQERDLAVAKREATTPSTVKMPPPAAAPKGRPAPVGDLGF
jgi:septal ring factor EnvC (AmiA/AmiB activator)